MERINGVFIGENIEVVLTDKYEIAFRRSKSGEFLESVLIKVETQDTKLIRKCIGICRTEPATTPDEKTKPVNWLYAFNSCEDILQNNEVSVSLLNTEVFSQDTIDNETFIFQFYDGQAYHVVYHEAFTTDELHPKCVLVAVMNFT